MGDKDPNDFAPYQEYLTTPLWPSLDHRTGVLDQTLVHRDTMPPQYAASALAKLVRWARIAPAGDIALYPDEDSREVEVRSTRLGKELAARAVNLDSDTFFGMYGEFGVGEDAEPREVITTLAITLDNEGLSDWSLKAKVALAAALYKELETSWKITEKFS